MKIAATLALLASFCASAVAGLLDDVRAHTDLMPAGQRVAEAIASADLAQVRGESDKGPGVVIRNREWIRQIGNAIRGTLRLRSDQCLCAGWRTVYFYRDGRLVASVAAIHGNQLRVHSPAASGDYPVRPEQWQRVQAALELPKLAATESGEEPALPWFR